MEESILLLLGHSGLWIFCPNAKGKFFSVLGVQNKPPQNVSVLHEDYFELKAIKTLQFQGKLLPLP